MPECGDSYIHSYPTKPTLKTITKNFGPSPPQALDSLQHLGETLIFETDFLLKTIAANSYIKKSPDLRLPRTEPDPRVVIKPKIVIFPHVLAYRTY